MGGVASVVRVGAWGESYVRSAEQNILRCLLASNNLPALARSGEVTLALYIGGTLDSELLRELGSVARIAYTDLKEYPVDNLRSRALLADTEFHSLDMARSLGADWYNFQCDHLINDGFLPAVRAKLDEGFGAVASSPFRVETEKFTAAHPAESRCFSAAYLYELSLQCRHDETINYFMCLPPRRIPADPHQFFFTVPGGFVAHTFQPCPYGIRTQTLPRSPGRHSTSEIALLSVIENVYLQKDPPGDFFLTGLDKRVGIPKFGSFTVEPKAVARSIRGFAHNRRSLAFAKRTLRERVFYPVPDAAAFGLPGNCRDESAAINEIMNRLDRDPVLFARLSLSFLRDTWRDFRGR